MRSSLLLLAAMACLPIAAGRAAPPGWYPSPYGAGDTIGAANNLSADIVRQAAKLVRTGKVYSLGMDIGDPALNGKPFANRTYYMHVEQQHPPGATVHDDRVDMSLGVFGTSMDGLGHVAIGDLFYNGTPAAEVYGEDGLKKLATNHIPPMVTRGILLDFAAWRGVDRLPPSMAINRRDIDAVARREHVAIRKGDVVLIHTGWLPSLIADPGLFDRQPGLGVEGARYLADRGVVAVGADNHGVEVIPAESGDPGAPYPVHPLLLAQKGVYLLEDVRTAELARDRAWEFLFVLGQPKLVGSAQVPINPVAIR